MRFRGSANMKRWYRFLGDVSSVFHVLVVLIILFGWLWPEYWYVYGVCLIGGAVSIAWKQRCILTDITHHLRSRAGQTFEMRPFLPYWAQKVLGQDAISSTLILRLAVIFYLVTVPLFLYNLLT